MYAPEQLSLQFQNEMHNQIKTIKKKTNIDISQVIAWDPHSFYDQIPRPWTKYERKTDSEIKKIEQNEE